MNNNLFLHMLLKNVQNQLQTVYTAGTDGEQSICSHLLVNIT